MTITYNKVLAYAFIMLGAINVAFGGWLLLLRNFNYSLIIGFILLLLAALYLTRPYFTLETSQVTVSAMVGPVKRTFFFRSPEDLKIEGSRLSVRDGERWKRVPVYRWMSDAADWKAMQSKLAAGSPVQTV